MTACNAKDQAPTQEQINELTNRVKANLVFVEGGTFTMGDFGPSTREDKLALTAWRDNKFLHDVTLDSFSMMAYRVTYDDYALYTAAKGLPNVKTLHGEKSIKYAISTIPRMPVGVNWQEANDYCQWLGEITGLPFDLPTEAQWEYAARNRGQNVIWATDNGEYEEGKHFPTYEQEKSYIKHLNLRIPAVPVYPIGQFPPSPMGFYDMGFGGAEWMKDWYDIDYYKNSPTHNPQGPQTGEEKSVRGSSDSGADTHMTVFRSRRALDYGPHWNTLVRCVVNTPTPIQP